MAHSDNARVIEEFYSGFQAGDAERMAACYHPDCTFEDPAFGLLKGEDVGDMWRFLLKPNKNGAPQVTFDNVSADGDSGEAHWEAKYKFGSNDVHNKVDARFEFKDGKIIKHVDKFDFWTWSSQALGIAGKLLGWTPILRMGVNSTTRSLLRKFQEKKTKQGNEEAVTPGGQTQA